MYLITKKEKLLVKIILYKKERDHYNKKEIISFNYSKIIKNKYKSYIYNNKMN
jgi:hypothetical protein